MEHVQLCSQSMSIDHLVKTGVRYSYIHEMDRFSFVERQRYKRRINDILSARVHDQTIKLFVFAVFGV